VPAPRHDHARRAQQAIPQQVSRLQLVDDRVRRYRLVDDLCHRLVSRGVEGLAARLDARDAVPSERPEQVAPHELDALQKALQLRAPASTRVVDGAIQVIDRRQQLLDEILVAVLLDLEPLARGAPAEVLEVRVQAQAAVAQRVELGGELRLAGRRPRRRLPRARGTLLAALDRLGGLAQRLLELGARRERAPRLLGVLPARLPALAGPARAGPLARARHEESRSPIACERKPTSATTRGQSIRLGPITPTRA